MPVASMRDHTWSDTTLTITLRAKFREALAKRSFNFRPFSRAFVVHIFSMVATKEQMGQPDPAVHGVDHRAVTAGEPGALRGACRVHPGVHPVARGARAQLGAALPARP